MTNKLLFLYSRLLVSYIILAIAFSPSKVDAEARSTIDSSVSGTLYVVGHGIGGNSSGLPPVPARITALDRATLREKFAFNALYEVRLSSDGASLYLAGIDHLLCVDSNTGRELWRVSTSGTHVASYSGFSDFWVSPHSRFLYFPRIYVGGDMRPTWIQIIDVTKQQMLPRGFTIPLSCVGSGESLLSPSAGEFMFVVCRDRVLAVDTRTHQIERDDRITLLGKAEAVWDKTISQDGRTIYLYSDRGTLIKYDVRRRRFTKPIPPLPRQSTMMYRGALMSLSGNGTKLVIARNIQTTSGIHSSSQFRVFDTRDWHLMAQFSVPIPITSLTVDTNGKKLYSVIDRSSSANPHPNDTFVEIDTEQGRVCAQHVRPGEHLAEILFRE